MSIQLTATPSKGVRLQSFTEFTARIVTEFRIARFYNFPWDQGVTGWLGDFFRFWWALFYWNSRKGWFRLRGAHRDDCPCQNAADSGLAHDTRCAASASWNRPERFRVVCPLLEKTHEGWRCSVEAEGVRPFWGRAIAGGIGVLACLYLVVTGAIYTTLRLTHQPVTYATIAWPGNWTALKGAQEKSYLERTEIALHTGDIQEAVRCLTIAREINPQNFDTSFRLAKLLQSNGRLAESEQAFEQLLTTIPERRVETARAYLRLLLAHASFARIIPLAGAMIAEDPDYREEWLEALLFSARARQNAQALETLVVQNPHYPEWCREAIQLEAALLSGRLTAVQTKLTHIGRGESKFLVNYKIERLLDLGLNSEAAGVFAARHEGLPPADAYLIASQLHLAKVIDVVPARPTNDSTLVVKECALSIAHGSSSELEGIHRTFLANPMSVSTDNGSLQSRLALWAAASATGASRISAQLESVIATEQSIPVSTLRELSALLGTSRPEPSIANVLPRVPLPTELIYAIVEKHCAIRSR